jgi:hypothetical protein
VQDQLGHLLDAAVDAAPDGSAEAQACAADLSKQVQRYCLQPTASALLAPALQEELTESTAGRQPGLIKARFLG